MSTIDLERLVVRQTYFIPLKENQLRDMIFAELNKQHFSYLDILPWIVTSEHKNCFSFERSMRWLYIDFRVSVGRDRNEIKRLAKEYSKISLKKQLEDLQTFVDNLPFAIHVRIVRSEDEGCQVEVECLPSLYMKLNRSVIDHANEFSIQDAALTCRRCMNDVFVSGLDATPISEQKIELPKKITEFLINNVASRGITDKLNRLLENATTEILVFGWIGTFYLKKLEELKTKGINIKVITGEVKTIRRDPMRKEKERAIKNLIKIIGKENISIKPEFHGRAIVVDNKALIGSMDLDSYSLTGVRIEFATYTEDSETVRSLRNYFNRIFTPWKEEEKHKS